MLSDERLRADDRVELLPTRRFVCYRRAMFISHREEV